MSVLALVSGSIFRAPEQRMSKAGKPFVFATVRVKEGGESRFVNVVAFSESAQSEVVRLSDGDSLSAQGPLKAEIYAANDGSTKVSLSIVADRVLPLRQPRKERKAKAPEPAAAQDERTRQQRLAGSWSAESSDPNDSIPF
jgi:single-stranded DNA-binding protein